MATAATDRTQALRTMQSWIRQGQLAAGQALPAERALAEQLSVGRKPLRWALEQLDEQGLIERVSARTRVVARQGGGTLSLLQGSVAVLAGERFGVGPYAGGLEQSALGWQAHVVLGAMDAVRDADRHVIKLSTRLLDARQVGELVQMGVSGVIVPQYRHNLEARQQMLQRMDAAGLRVVVEGDRPEDADRDRVAPDHETGGYLLAQHLLKLGRRRVLHLTAPNAGWWVQARLRGYRRAMHDAGLEPAEPLCVPPSPWNDATDGGGKCFAQVARYNAGHLAQPLTADDRPDAIMCLSDEAVSYVTAGIKLLHLDPARDVVVAGYDNYWQQTWGHQHEPAAPIATVDKHNDRVGEALVELLLEPPAGDSPVRRVIPPSLISDPARPTPDR